MLELRFSFRLNEELPKAQRLENGIDFSFSLALSSVNAVRGIPC